MNHLDGALDLARFSFRLADNPHLPPAYVASLRQEFTGLWRKRFIDGLWVIAEGACYDMFDEDRHVVDVCPVIKRWLCCSIDYGTRNPFDALLIGLGSTGSYTSCRSGGGTPRPGAAAHRRAVFGEPDGMAGQRPVPRLADVRGDTGTVHRGPVRGELPGAVVPGPPVPDASR